jgi:hypothetical protein
MHVSMTVQTANTNASVDESGIETFAGSNVAVASTMLRVIKRMAQAMDVDFSQLMSEVVSVLTPDEKRLVMTARMWPLFIAQYGSDEPVIVYCGDEDCPLNAENSEILRLEMVNDDMSELDGGNTTLRDLEVAIVDHIEKRRERESETPE